jgi:hypothetical protein
VNEPRAKINHHLIVENDSSLDGALVSHRLQALAPLLELEGLVDDSGDLYFAGIEVPNGGGEHVGLREGTEDGDLVTKDLAGRPADTRRVAVHTVDDQLTAAADVVNGVFENLG